MVLTEWRIYPAMCLSANFGPCSFTLLSTIYPFTSKQSKEKAQLGPASASFLSPPRWYQLV